MSTSFYPGDLIAGRFKLIRPLGKGGHGEVYLAEQTSMQRRVALKLLSMKDNKDPRVVERFRREARQTCRLNHPNTVVCFDFGDDPGRRLLFLAMEYLPGETLSELLTREGALTPVRTLDILEQMAGSLADAHEKGLVHRDLKPSNVIITTRDQGERVVKVIDFGIAKIFGDEKIRGKQKRLSLTEAGLVMGTPYYMSPEQIRREVELDHRVDVYALGVLAFEMLTGRPPFNAMSPVEVMRCHLQDDPPLLHQVAPTLDLPEALNEVIHRAMSKDRAFRYDSTHRMVQAFQEALEGGIAETTRLNSAMIAKLDGEQVEENRPNLLDELEDDGLATMPMNVSDMAHLLNTTPASAPAMKAKEDDLATTDVDLQVSSGLLDESAPDKLRQRPPSFSAAPPTPSSRVDVPVPGSRRTGGMVAIVIIIALVVLATGWFMFLR